MSKKARPNQFCPVAGCETKERHESDPLVAKLLSLYQNPVLVSGSSLFCMRQLSASVHDEVKAERTFALMTRLRQVVEMAFRLQFCILVASASGLPHYLSESYPNSFNHVYERVIRAYSIRAASKLSSTLATQAA
jgi:hypothetical protein